MTCLRCARRPHGLEPFVSWPGCRAAPLMEVSPPRYPQPGQAGERGQGGANSQTRGGAQPEAKRLAPVNAEHRSSACSVLPWLLLSVMRKMLKIPTGERKIRPQNTPGVRVRPVPAARTHPWQGPPQRAPLQEKMLVIPGGIGMMVRQNDECPKPSKVVALLPCPGLARSGGSSSFTVCGSCDPEGCLRATARTTVEVLVTCWLLFSLQEARQPPRRTATTPLESISSSPSFTLEVRLAPVQGAVAAVPGARARSQPSSRSRHRQSSPRSCPVREQPRLAAGRNHGASSPSSSCRPGQ